MEKLEISLIQIISYSGEARSPCFGALRSYCDGDREVGRRQYKDTKENLYTTRRARSRILKQSAGGEFDQISLLVVHVEDQIMVSEIIYQVTRELSHCMSGTKE